MKCVEKMISAEVKSVIIGKIERLVRYAKMGIDANAESVYWKVCGIASMAFELGLFNSTELSYYRNMAAMATI